MNIPIGLNARVATCIRSHYDRSEYPQAKTSICRTSVGVFTQSSCTKSCPRLNSPDLIAFQTPHRICEAIILAIRFG
ncbi:predicted protein [Plenodomus lingam JN3]|uniref:Predicted protein n=1 Tax=Leptosphaeria maculans (strain JN3 / isolate v23.1.3 / race Av1-4-5-6-7-8) TaxID=985895 RepID=E5A5H1_LEPMJ|nr:predicted protein [Plenodomus lingam JN3]CBX98869.1 predicted protein [Plenodomus lingam JN3]